MSGASTDTAAQPAERPVLHRLKRVDARIEPFEWSFPIERRTEIDAQWARLKADKPAMFNGRVLLQCRGEIVGDTFRASYFATDYADFITWLRGDQAQVPGSHIRNGFALGALRSRDGAYLMGVMGHQTVNAGMIYFAGGTPDPHDVMADGTVDLTGSLLRELAEETGISAEDVTVEDEWSVLLSRARAAFLRDVFIDLPADEARALIRSRLAAQSEPELADIAIARSVADIDSARMPVFMQVFLADAFTSGRAYGLPATMTASR